LDSGWDIPTRYAIVFSRGGGRFILSNGVSGMDVLTPCVIVDSGSSDQRDRCEYCNKILPIDELHHCKTKPIKYLKDFVASKQQP
jgi:hypothetical protein